MLKPKISIWIMQHIFIYELMINLLEFVCRLVLVHRLTLFVLTCLHLFACALPSYGFASMMMPLPLLPSSCFRFRFHCSAAKWADKWNNIIITLLQCNFQTNCRWLARQHMTNTQTHMLFIVVDSNFWCVLPRFRFTCLEKWQPK